MFPSTSNLCYIAFTLSIKCCLNTSSHIQTFPKLDWQDCPTSSDRPRCVWADLILTWGRQQCTLFLPLSHRQPRGAWFWYGHLPPCRLCAPSPPLMLLFFPGQLEEQLQADRASNVPPSLHSDVPFNLHGAPPGPFTPRLDLSRSPSTGHQHGVQLHRTLLGL